jgi:hypothetical protein
MSHIKAMSHARIIFQARTLVRHYNLLIRLPTCIEHRASIFQQLPESSNLMLARSSAILSLVCVDIDSNFHPDGFSPYQTCRPLRVCSSDSAKFGAQLLGTKLVVEISLKKISYPRGIHTLPPSSKKKTFQQSESSSRNFSASAFHESELPQANVTRIDHNETL